ncbi:MAG: YceD family protein [Verrucomicrobiales bacterium]
MKIDLGLLPDEGQFMEGELPAEALDLKEDGAEATGPLRYGLHVQRFADELLLQGSLSAPFTFTCVRTLKNFVQTIEVPSAAIAIHLDGEEVVDATEALREELLILLPANPTCDQADDPQDCEIDSKYLALDKEGDSDVKTPPAPERDTRWDALDSLQQPEN